MSAKPSRKGLCAVVLLLVTGWSAAALSTETASAASATDSVDAHFSQQAATAGVAEVNLGELALKKSSDNSVKTVAQRIVDDHTKMNAKLASLGNQKQITLPTQPSADASEAYAKLTKQSGRAFDHAWTKMMITDHQNAVKLFTTEASKGKDRDLRTFAATAVPILQSHLDAAKQLAALPKARNDAMDNTIKSMNTSDPGPPATASTAAAAPVSIPTPISAPAASPAAASSSPTRSSAPAGQKH